MKTKVHPKFIRTPESKMPSLSSHAKQAPDMKAKFTKHSLKSTNTFQFSLVGLQWGKLKKTNKQLLKDILEQGDMHKIEKL